VEGADSYMLWLGDSLGIGLKSVRVTATEAGCPSGAGTCSFSPDWPLDHGKYYWKVNGINTAGAGPWSTRMSFTY